MLGASALWQEFARGRHVAAAVLAILALTVGPIGLLAPRLIRWVYVGLMVVTFPIGWVMSQVVLAIIFFGIFTPVALVFRLIGRDILNRRWEPDRESYWMPRASSDEPRGYFRQF